MKTSKTQNGADILSSPFFNQIREKNPILFGQFYGSFFRSTMSIVAKLEMLNDFLISKNEEELLPLIQILKDNYNIEDIPKRNADWRWFYDI